MIQPVPTDLREARARSALAAWGAATRRRLSLRRFLVWAGVWFAIAFVLNVWVMAAWMDGYRTPEGSPGAGEGNEIQGALFYFVLSFALSMVVGYALSGGPARFRADVRTMLSGLRTDLGGQSGRALASILSGMAVALLVRALVGPSVAAVLAFVTLGLAAPLLRVIVVGLAVVLHRVTIGRVGRFSSAPSSSAVMLGALGSAIGSAVGWLVPAGSDVAVLLAVVAGIGAVVMGRRFGGAAASFAWIVLATGIAALFVHVGTVLADDGGVAECSPSDVVSWLFACEGSLGVLARGAGAGVPAAAGGGLGGLLGGGGGDTPPPPPDYPPDWNQDEEPPPPPERPPEYEEPPPPPERPPDVVQ